MEDKTELRDAIASELVLSVTGAKAIVCANEIQSLWSGYGQILRLQLDGGNYPSVILKYISPPNSSDHPRGWNTSLSHQRKVRSYQVESTWYQDYASRCGKNCPVPTCLAVKSSDSETVLVLTDLDAQGYDLRKTSVDIEDIHACLKWLANFHATFLNSKADGLWQCGTYWHLETRPDELEALSDEALRRAAPAIDRALKQSRYQTLVHGDAKLANFCFSGDPAVPVSVAAVDFQYVGRGCGMKDLAYFIGSCLYDDQCEAMEEELLDYYFLSLHQALSDLQSEVDWYDLEQDWRALYPVAWADFHRFIKGWSPGHWKINSYSERLTASVIRKLTS